MPLRHWITYNYRIILDEIERTIQKETSILDVGCGGGLILVLFSKVLRSHHLVGMDISRDKVKRAKKKGLEVILADAHYPPFKTSAFEYAFLKDLLHHAQRPIECLKKTKQVCRKHIVVEANKNNPVMILARSINSTENHFTPHQLRSLITCSGLRIKSFKKMHIYPLDFVVRSKNPAISTWNIFISKLVKRKYPVVFLKVLLLISRVFVRTPSYNMIFCD